MFLNVINGLTRGMLLSSAVILSFDATQIICQVFSKSSPYDIITGVSVVSSFCAELFVFLFCDSVRVVRGYGNGI